MAPGSQNSSMTNSMASSKSLLDLNEIEYEQVLHDAFHKAKAIARTDTFTNEVLIAKLAVLAIRQLHASDVYPRTSIRAMVLMEFDEDHRSTGGAIARAKRDIRDEDRARRAEVGPARAGPPKATLAKADQKAPQQQSMFAYNPKAAYIYTTAMVPPTGIHALAPNGFPTLPFPSTATVPQAFIDAMIIRVRVFIDEQKCDADVELDEDDPRSWHWPGGRQTTRQIPVSVIRIVPPPHGPHPNGDLELNEGKAVEEPTYLKLGRVATMKEWRGKGLSRRLIEEAFGWLRKHGREDVGQGWQGDVLCHAQVAVEKMYERLGFRTDDRLGRWVEEGIDHLGMWRRIEVDR
ncbi:hypothetical protein DV737_g3589, partial [Chaetothyriales sp. CBS 132003]